MPLTLHGIGTAVPAQQLSQAEAVQVAHRINAESPEQAKLMSRIYQKSKVLSRGSVLLENDRFDGRSKERLSFYGTESPGTPLNGCRLLMSTPVLWLLRLLQKRSRIAVFHQEQSHTS